MRVSVFTDYTHTKFKIHLENTHLTAAPPPPPPPPPPAPGGGGGGGTTSSTTSGRGWHYHITSTTAVLKRQLQLEVTAAGRA